MAKPIVVIHTPIHFSGSFTKSQEMAAKDRDHLSVNYPDYYWFIFPDPKVQIPQFQVFYEKDFTEIQYEELKQLITDAIEQQKLK